MGKCGGIEFIKEAMAQVALELKKEKEEQLKLQSTPSAITDEHEDKKILSQAVDDAPTITNFDEHIVALEDHESEIIKCWNENERNYKINGPPKLKGKLLHKLKRKK